MNDTERRLTDVAAQFGIPEDQALRLIRHTMQRRLRELRRGKKARRR